ncbi:MULTISPECIES: helix-turn-helix domain-containing protein [Streptomyces]|uniref:Helix-turn-helix domain-containing protein n=1 Tax=Streptomyces lonegramiae TaxID=3075524 RepID=A0ABU2XW46_9ACTN|nr:helix-turn-helix domain-containing protein [Streptomyces sp. DSM 41529]MDT0550145.1 helix-turn-helix domain-containing protein [Streptomyces sp. DSM 41529]
MSTTPDADAAEAPEVPGAADRPGPPRMRADARRNREQILCAARSVFAEQGPDAPLDEIARRAGVGIATLYRRFPERADLIRAVAIDVFTALVETAHRAAEEACDPLDALRRFMHAALDLKIGSVVPSLLGRVTVDELVDAVSQDAADPVDELLRQAREAGLVRSDVVFGDITLLLIRLARPLPGGLIPEDEALAHRHLDVYLDGLRPAGSPRPNTPLSGPALDSAAFKRLRGRVMGGGSD